MRGILRAIVTLAPALLFAQAPSAPTRVRAVLFFSPTCPHCHKVMTIDLPPITRRYGDRLQIAVVDVTTAEGQAMYRATVAHFALPNDRIGVPTLVIGGTVLVGDEEIPTQLPRLVDRGLAGIGIDWPNVPEIRDALKRVEAAQAPRGSAAPESAHEAPEKSAPMAKALAPAVRTPDSASKAAAPPMQPLPLTESRAPTMRERFLADPVGNGAAVGVLILMLLALVVVAVEFTGTTTRLPELPSGVVPVLALVGFGVASYLALVELTGTRAVCGPVGDCNTVQQSEYARLFGVLPIGVLGMAGYFGVIAAWLLSRFARRGLARLGALAAWGMALAGAAFSVYLTFLEPFVIGATCAWCLASALTVTLLLLALTPGAQRAWRAASAPR